MGHAGRHGLPLELTVHFPLTVVSHPSAARVDELPPLLPRDLLDRELRGPLPWAHRLRRPTIHDDFLLLLRFPTALLRRLQDLLRLCQQPEAVPELHRFGHASSPGPAPWGPALYH